MGTQLLRKQARGQDWRRDGIAVAFPGFRMKV